MKNQISSPRLPRSKSSARQMNFVRMRSSAESGTAHELASVVKEDEAEVQDYGGPAPRSPYLTGNMDISTIGATNSFAARSLATEKTIVIIRHGMSSWNDEGRIQV